MFKIFKKLDWVGKKLITNQGIAHIFESIVWYEKVYRDTHFEYRVNINIKNLNILKKYNK